MVGLLLVWLGWSLLSGWWTPSAADWRDTIGGFRAALVLLALYPLRGSWRLLCGALILGNCFTAVVQILQAGGLVPIHGTGNELRPAGLDSHPVHVALFQAVGIAFAVGWLPVARSTLARALLLGASVLLAVGVALAAGRAAILGLALGLPIAVALLAWRHPSTRPLLLRWGGVALLTLGLAGGVVWASGAGGLQRQSADLAATSDPTTSTGQRFLWWRASLRAFGEHPIRGQGIGASRTILRTDPEVRQALADHPSYGESAFFVAHPHSAYLQTLAEQGLIGAAIVLAFAVAVGRASLRRAAEHPIACGIAGGLVVWAVAAAFDALHMNGRTATLGCILIALGALPSRHRAERPSLSGAD